MTFTTVVDFTDVSDDGLTSKCLKFKSMRQLKGYLEAPLNNKTLFLRRGSYTYTNDSNEDDFIVFIERETKNLIKFNIREETFSNFVDNLDLSNPFAIKFMKDSKCFIISDVNKATRKEIKLLDENFNILKSIKCNDLKWPHDICLTNDEKFAFISDFEASVVLKIELESGKIVEKLFQYKPIDVKISLNKIFVVSSCDYDTECEKLIFINGNGNSIKVYDVNTCIELYTISHASLLEPQGLYIDEKKRVVYCVGQYVNEYTHKIDDYLCLFSFDLDNYKFLSFETLSISRLETTICDIFIWKDKKLILSAFKDEIFIYDLL